MENALIVMAVLLGGTAVLWIASHFDQFVQKQRKVEADEFGRRPDGLVAKVVLTVFIVGGFVWYLKNGGGSIDPNWPYRR